jgi:hypothetical protein
MLKLSKYLPAALGNCVDEHLTLIVVLYPWRDLECLLVDD